jgi:hypothetical protein
MPVELPEAIPLEEEFLSGSEPALRGSAGPESHDPPEPPGGLEPMLPWTGAERDLLVRVWRRLIPGPRRPFDPTAVRELLPFLDHPAPAVRCHALGAFALPGVRLADAAVPIARGLCDPAPAVRWQALAGLCRFADATACSDLGGCSICGWNENGEPIIDADRVLSDAGFRAAFCGRRFAARLREDAVIPDVTAQPAAAVPVLVEILRDTDPRLQDLDALVLSFLLAMLNGDVARKEAADALLSRLDDGFCIRFHLVRRLAAAGLTARLIESLHGLTRAGKTAWMVKAWDQLGDSGVPGLLEIVRDENRPLEERGDAAAACLSTLAGDPTYSGFYPPRPSIPPDVPSPPLPAVVTDTLAPVLSAAIRAASKGRRYDGSDLTDGHVGLVLAAGCAGHYAAGVVPAIAERLSAEPDHGVPITCIESLIRIGRPTGIVVAALMDAAKPGRPWWVRRCAVEGLGEFGAAAAAAVPLLRDIETECRSAWWIVRVFLGLDDIADSAAESRRRIVAALADAPRDVVRVLR